MKLEIKNLHVMVSGKEIVRGVDLTAEEGKVNVIMGPNGSGKSTLAFALMGHPEYKIMKGKILLDGKDITGMSPDERAKMGLFLSFQYPSEVSGVSVANFLRTAYVAVKGEKIPPNKFAQLLKEKMELLKMNRSFSDRYLNEGFSGGEKKRTEILQMAVLEPRIAILDETDSGLDIDALRTVAEGVKSLKKNVSLGVLLITHYQRLLNHIKPDNVNIMINGRIVKSGNASLAEEVEEKGYDWISGLRVVD